ncbi:MAG: hypothetical protein CMQ49_02260 [Gammaproteobacteria bacterium]|nr:hypothetical protein [Gammaproteobacteria bacterium]
MAQLGRWLADFCIVAGGHAVEEAVRVHQGDGSFGVDHEGAGYQACGLKHPDEGEIGAQPRLAGFVHTQRQHWAEHQVDQRYDAYALPAAVCSEKEVRVPAEQD